MKTTKLAVLNEDGKEIELRFLISIHLNEMIINLQSKRKSNNIWVDEIVKKYEVDKDFDIHETTEKLYLKYLEMRDIEKHWIDALNGTSVIEFNLEDEDSQ